MFWNKKQEPEPGVENTTRRNTLTIKLKGSEVRWWVDDYIGSSFSMPWKRFYKWYFSERQKELVMKSTHQHTLLRREDIVGFSVSIGDIKI